MTSINTITTAPQLADYLGIEEKTLRSWLRKDDPARAPGQGGEWSLTPEMNLRMAERADVELEEDGAP